VAAERHFGERLAALTGGRYTVDVVAAAALGDHNRMIEQVRTGTSPWSGPRGEPRRVRPRFECCRAVRYPRPADLFTALDGALGAVLSRIAGAAGLGVFVFFAGGTLNVYNARRPVRTPADLRGLRLRVPGDAVMIDTFNALGATAVPLAATEVQGAIRRGAVDGAEGDLVHYVGGRHVEVATTWSWTRHRVEVDALLVGAGWLAALPRRDRDAVVTAAREAAAYEAGLRVAQTAALLADLGARNVHIDDDVDVAAFRRAVGPVIDQHRGSFGDLARLLPVG
jgi:TRAP-type C4-dicarboxylate transport system substrate-binding protein